jgi:hypothetical protein
MTMADTPEVPLPEPHKKGVFWKEHILIHKGEEWFTTDQLRAYGDARAVCYHAEQMRLMGFEHGAVAIHAYERRGEALFEARDECQRLAARIRELEAERDALRVDAERYAHLKRMADYIKVEWIDPEEGAVCALDAAHLDAAIDQARGKP